MPGLLRNSLDKVAEVYFAGVCSQSFTYAGKTHKPKEIYVSPHIFRGTTCPMSCGGCCARFSLVFLPSDPRPDSPFIKEVQETVNGVTRLLYVDPQTDHQDHFCRHLVKTTGRCGIHGVHPFSCRFETIRFTHQEDRCDIANRLFGRGWSYERVTGQVGAQCDLLPASEKHRDENVEKMVELKKWADYWNLPTHLERIIEWMRLGPHDVPLVIKPGKRTLFDRI